MVNATGRMERPNTARKASGRSVSYLSQATEHEGGRVLLHLSDPTGRSVLVKAPPGSQVSLDGQELGAAPVSEQTLFEGEHRLRVTHEDAVWERDFVLTGEQRLVFTADVTGE